jgi:hypothetical protein
MDALPGWAMANAACDAVEEEAWLLGQPHLQDYLDYVRDTVVGGATLQRSTLVDEWREANEHYYDLEVSEAGAADQIEVLDLPAVMRPLADEVMSSSRYRRAFASVPTRFAMVELGRLIAGQPHVNVSHAERLRAQLSPSPSPEEVFRFCLPVDSQDIQVKVKRAGEQRLTFWSESAGLRFHEATMLKPEQIRGYEALGSVCGILGLMVGFGSNFLCAIQADNRVVLNNGHHRAYALMEHGVTHAPCIVETVTRRDELNLVAASDVQEDPAFYFKAPRPPLLKDFLDPRFRKVLRVPRMLRVVDVSFEVQSYEIPV